MKKILVPLIITSSSVILLFLMFDHIETFFTDLLDQARDNPLKYAGLSFVVLVSDIVLPVPSSIVMYSNGAVLGLFSGFALSMVSVILSSVTGYFIGLGSAAVLKSEADVSAGQILEKYGSAAILLTRGIPVISESICVVCGFNRYDLTSYLMLNLIGYIPVCLIYAYFGSLVISRNLFLVSFAGSLFITAVLWFLGRVKIRRDKSK